ncbi:hypothetical protein LP417_04915 [Polaromonas sp. P1-6]|nr:hypothetical protein LP417_04915 [Polaromonas sp. P1-6]
MFGKARSDITTKANKVASNVLQLVAKRVMCRFTASTPSRLFGTRDHRIAHVFIQDRRTFERSVSIQYDFNLHLLRGVADWHE